MSYQDSFIYDYALAEMQNVAADEIIKNLERIISSSSIILRNREELMQRVFRDEDYHELPDTDKDKDLVGILESLLSSYKVDKSKIKSEIEIIRDRKQRLSSSSMPYENADTEIEELEIESRRNDNKIQRTEHEISRIEKDLDIHYLVVPVSTPDYEGIRIILPIEEKETIAPESLIDYVYTFFGMEASTNLQDYIFEDNTIEDSLKNVHFVNSSFKDGSSFRAIDIECPLVDEEYSLNDILEIPVEYFDELFENIEDYYSRNGNTDFNCELLKSSLNLKGIVIPTEFQDDLKENAEFYCMAIEDVKDEFLKSFSDSFKEIDPRCLEYIVNHSSIDLLFEEFPLYQKECLEKLEESCEELRQEIRKKYFGDYVSNGFDEKSSKRPSGMISKKEALNIYFFGFSDKKKEGIYARICEEGILEPKIVAEREYVSEEQLKEMNKYIVQLGRYIGCFKEPVISGPEFSMEYNIDGKKLNQLFKDPAFMEELNPCLVSKTGSGLLVLKNDKKSAETILNVYRRFY